MRKFRYRALCSILKSVRSTLLMGAAFVAGPVFAQHGRFQDDLLDSGGDGLGFIGTLVGIVIVILIIRAIRKSPESRKGNPSDD